MIQDLALILIVASIVTLLFKRLKQPLVLGYIVAGFLVSPHMPYIMSVVEKNNIQEWADIGVMFTLFSLGLEFSFKKIVKMGVAPIISALTIVGCMMILGFSVGHFFGWKNIDCIFLGGMLAMSSTTIIYKAFDDLELRQQHFASLVISVLILEDILAIVMMVMLSAVATGEAPDSGEMLMSILRIGFFLILWFVVGIFAIPAFLRSCRKYITSETLLIISLGLCCLMAVVSHTAGFSEAFGAFVMGSILAETIEAEKIEKVIEPVKNLFGAIFFVSVGMLVDPFILINYATPICIIVLTIIIGQAIFGTLGFFLSGQPLRTAMRCGFSMAQIGEFAFIIASLGLSLGVIADFLYPVVVAVSVITTFLTPYMIRMAVPAYNTIEKHLPKSAILALNSLTIPNKNNTEYHSANAVGDTPNARILWHRLLKSMLLNTLIYSILAATATVLMLSFFLIFSRRILPHWWANGLTGIVTVLLIAPFLRAIVMKKNHSTEWQQLWAMSPMHRLPLISTIVARGVIVLAFLFYICNYLARFANAIVICLGILVIIGIVLSRNIKRRSIRLERIFINNLRSRDIAAQVKGTKRPLYADRLLARDIHLADVTVPENSIWAGHTLSELALGQRFGIHISSILRSQRRINIPGGEEIIFPNDRLQIIGTDEQIMRLSTALSANIIKENHDIERQEMILRQLAITKSSPLLGKTLRDSGLRENYGLMLVGLETGESELLQVAPDYTFELGDILWVVGERGAKLLS